VPKVDNNYLVKNLTGNTLYYVKLKHVDKWGNRSSASTQVSATTKSNVAPPAFIGENTTPAALTGVLTYLDPDTIILDNESGWEDGYSVNYTIPRDGVYQIDTSAVITSFTGSLIRIYILKAPGGVKYYNSYDNLTSSTMYVTNSTSIFLEEGELISAAVQVDTYTGAYIDDQRLSIKMVGEY
jgi:hypothetical protein